MVEDRHVIETLGKVEVVIENGEITSVGSSEMTYCPMFHAMHGVDELNEEFIRKNINFRIEDFGMCTPDRVVEMDDAVTVGISEILKTNMEKGNIDCVVGACDGAGTLLMTNPRVVQGVGGRVSPKKIKKKFTKEHGFKYIAMGQNAEKGAEEELKNCNSNGEWLFLQNIHLMPKWLKRLETILWMMM